MKLLFFVSKTAIIQYFASLRFIALFLPKTLLANSWKYGFVCLISYYFFLSDASSQSISNKRAQKLVVTDTLVNLDSLSIIPKTFKILFKNEPLDSSKFSVDFVKAQLKLNETFLNDTISVSYRVFPIYFENIFQLRDSSIIDNYGDERFQTFENNNEAGEAYINFGKLNYNGSFSRAFSVGNQQDLVVNSNFNLQFSGTLLNNVAVNAAISDQTIPIQPEGNTAQLQDFDKIFIEFKKKNNSLTFGDLLVRNKEGYFLKYLKKLQGVDLKTSFTNQNNRQFNTGASLAIARGKFTRNTFIGEEANQGPYKLFGELNELFIIILSGTERVYVDGQQLQRGSNKDYTIDYNLGELIFTNNYLITKDKRIAIEFEYAEQNYSKTLARAYHQTKIGKWEMGIDFFSEQDGKNQPIGGPFSNEQLTVLESAGNDVNKAVLPGYSLAQFQPEQNLYLVKDTIINDVLYNDVFELSSDSTKVLFSVSFSNVGYGNGNYIISAALNNNRSYQWIAPNELTGESNGNFEPVIQLISPKRRQLTTLNAGYEIHKKHKIKTELALSNSDFNTFSTIGDSTNFALATALNYTGEIPISEQKKINMTNTIDYEYKPANFKVIERYRAIEFKRNWNTAYNSDTVTESWLRAKSNVTFTNGSFAPFYNRLSSKNYYRGDNIGFLFNYKDDKITATANSNLLLSTEDITKSIYLINNYIFNKKFKKLVTGATFLQEILNNRNLKTEDFKINSFRFDEYGWNIGTSEKNKKRQLQLNLGYRNDFEIKANEMTKKSQAIYGTLKGILETKNSKNGVKYGVTYRSLNFTEAFETRAGENTLLANVDYKLNIFNGFIKSNSFYKISVGQQQKVEYTFAEVQAGQGNFSWVDYNSNNQKEENEFELAAFTDSARYVRLTIPTDLYVKTNRLEFNQTAQVDFKKIINSKNKFANFISKLQLNSTYTLDKHSQTDSSFLNLYNPYYQSNLDSSLVNGATQMYNKLIYNKSNTKFNCELFHNLNSSKILLNSGFDERITTNIGAKFRWNILKTLSFENIVKQGSIINSSSSFSNRNFNIELIELNPSVSTIIKKSVRLSLAYRYKNAVNTNEIFGNNEQLSFNEIVFDSRFNQAGKGSIQANFTYNDIDFTGDESTSLAYTMLESLRTGNNYRWTLRYSRNLKRGINFSINYNGRKLGLLPVTHTGNASVRAIF